MTEAAKGVIVLYTTWPDRESVERAAGWVREFEASDPDGAAAMVAELEDLAGERVSVDVPDATGSLAAMQSVLAARAGRSGD